MLSWSLGAAFGGGLALGLVNFSLLAVTATRLLEAKRPMLLAMGSFYGRLTILTACLYLLAGGHGGRAAAAVAGLLLGRGIVLRHASRIKKAVPVPTAPGGRE